MSDNQAGHHDAPAPAPASSSWGWAGDFAASAWNTYVGVNRAEADIAMGVAKEIYHHPIKTAIEVGVGVGTAVAAGYAGLGTVAAGAVLAVPAAGYVAYKTLKVVHDEGLSAVPKHYTHALHHLQNEVTDTYNAAKAVISPNVDEKTKAAADQKLQNAGKAATPFIAGAVGGMSGGVAGSAVEGVTGAVPKVADSLLSRLEVPGPQLATAGAPRVAVAIERTTATSTILPSLSVGDFGGINGAVTSKVIEGKSGGADSGAGSGGAESGRGSSGDSTRLTDVQRNRSVFVDGRAATPEIAVVKGGAIENSLRNAFQNADSIIARGGRIGDLQVSRDAQGDLTAKYVDGPRDGVEAFLMKGDHEFHVANESVPNSQPRSYPMVVK